VVRPRIYSNQRLLDLILCLADKIDECCGDHPPRPRRRPSRCRCGPSTSSSATADGAETPVTACRRPCRKRLWTSAADQCDPHFRFNKPLAADLHQPTTHA